MSLYERARRRDPRRVTLHELRSVYASIDVTPHLPYSTVAQISNVDGACASTSSLRGGTANHWTDRTGLRAQLAKPEVRKVMGLPPLVTIAEEAR